MITVTETMIASRAGHRYGMDHIYADGSTALKVAHRNYSSTEARAGFMRAWRLVSGLPEPAQQTLAL